MLTKVKDINIRHSQETFAQVPDQDSNTYLLATQPKRTQTPSLPVSPHSQKGAVTTLVVVDGNLDYDDWLAVGVDEQTSLLRLKPDQDGVEQISRAMRAYGFVQHLHILAWGAPGCLYLGNGELTLETLPKYRLQLLTWFMARLRWASAHVENQTSPECLYTPACTLSLYACQVAAGEVGTELLQRLHYLTGAQLAASTQLIGNQVLGGTWALDTIISDRILHNPSTGCPIPALPIDAQTLAVYPRLLTSLR